MNNYSCPASDDVDLERSDVERLIMENVDYINRETKIITLEGLTHGMLIQLETHDLNFLLEDGLVSIEPRIENIREINKQLRNLSCQITSVGFAGFEPDDGTWTVVPLWTATISHFVEFSSMESYYRKEGRATDDEIEDLKDEIFRELDQSKVHARSDPVGEFLVGSGRLDEVSEICKVNGIPLYNYLGHKLTRYRWDLHNEEIRNIDDPMFG